jgi:RNA polymerase sigma-70 factor (family 1)
MPMDVQSTCYKPCCDAGFKAVYAAYFQRLVFFAHGIIDDQAEAEDITAEIFLKYWNKRQDFVTQKAIKAFLYISTKNACLNLLRQRRNIERNKHRFASQLHRHAEPVLHEIVHRELLADAEDVIETLPRACRRIIRLTFDRGQSNQKIAQQLSISVHTVKNQKCRGIKLMQERFAKLQGG